MAEKNYEVRDTSGEILGTFDSKEETNKFIEDNNLEQHFYETLPEVTVTARRPFYATPQFQEVWGSRNPIWGLDRVRGVRQAWQRNPKYMQSMADAQAVGAAVALSPFAVQAAGEYVAPWLVENIFPYLTARGWLAATEAAGNTPAWLTPTTATAIDAGLIAAPTGASVADMVENGPSVGNVTGTALGFGGLALEAAPTLVELYQNGRRAYNTYRLGRQLNTAAKAFDGTVGPEYFHAPDKWYRITSSPEIYGIREQGMNVTTTDLGDIPNSANQFRMFVMKNGLVPGTGENEGFWVLPQRIRDAARNRRIATEAGEARPTRLFDLDENPSLFRKIGSAHGNRSQAAWQVPWGGTTSTTTEFPEYILEGSPLADLTIPYGKRRSFFTSLPIDEVPFGARVGFKTGEMPIEGLRAFRRLPNGRYQYEGEVIPNRTITLDSYPTQQLRKPTPSYKTFGTFTPSEFSESFYTADGLVTKAKAPQLGVYLGDGSEATVFENGDRVYKIIRNPSPETGLTFPFTHDMTDLFIERFINTRNKHSIFEPLTFEGTIVDTNGNLFPVVSQKKVTPLASTVDRELVTDTFDSYRFADQIRDFMLKNGYTERTYYGLSNWTNQYGSIGDISASNIGLNEDNKLRVIDGLFGP